MQKPHHFTCSWGSGVTRKQQFFSGLRPLRSANSEGVDPCSVRTRKRRTGIAFMCYRHETGSEMGFILTRYTFAHLDAKKSYYCRKIFLRLCMYKWSNTLQWGHPNKAHRKTHKLNAHKSTALLNLHSVLKVPTITPTLLQLLSVRQITRKSCVDRIWQNFVQRPDFFFFFVE